MQMTVSEAEARVIQAAEEWEAACDLVTKGQLGIQMYSDKRNGLRQAVENLRQLKSNGNKRRSLF